MPEVDEYTLQMDLQGTDDLFISYASQYRFC